MSCYLQHPLQLTVYGHLSIRPIIIYVVHTALLNRLKHYHWQEYFSLWDVTLRNSVDLYQHFGRTCCRYIHLLWWNEGGTLSCVALESVHQTTRCDITQDTILHWYRCENFMFHSILVTLWFSFRSLDVEVRREPFCYSLLAHDESCVLFYVEDLKRRVASYKTYCEEPETTRTRKPYTCNLTNELLNYKKKGKELQEMKLSWLSGYHNCKKEARQSELTEVL
jgi:hypothetical protein